jgi:hypothetical protein
MQVAIQELTLSQHIVPSINLASQSHAYVNKRDAKAMVKEESKVEHDDSVPLTLNYHRFLLDEKK